MSPAISEMGHGSCGAREVSQAASEAGRNPREMSRQGMLEAGSSRRDEPG